MSAPKKNLVLIGLICAFAYFCGAAMGACSKLISTQVSIITILFFQNGICLLLTLPRIVHRGWSSLRTEKMGLHLARDLAGVVSFFCLFFALENIPLVEGSLLQSTGPLWLPLIGFVWLRIEMYKHLWWGILMGFIGIVLILKPGIQPLSTAFLAAIASGIFSGFSLLAIHRLAATEPTHRILFYYFLVGVLLTGPFILFNFSIPSRIDLLLLLSVGLLTYLTQTLVIYALRYAKAVVLAPIAYSIIIYSGFFDWLIWKNVPDLWTCFGVLLVVAGVSFSLYVENRSQKKIAHSTEASM